MGYIAFLTASGNHENLQKTNITAKVRNALMLLMLHKESTSWLSGTAQAILCNLL